MSLQGRLRHMGLAEVLQLMAMSRSSGALQLEAPLEGRKAIVQLVQGTVVDAWQWNSDVVPEPSQARSPLTPQIESPSAAEQATERIIACLCELMTWREGSFRLDPPHDGTPDSGLRLSVDTVLMDAARFTEAWEPLRDRLPHAHVVPEIVNAEVTAVPLPQYSPLEWELLTRIDGQCDLMTLAHAVGRDLVEVATMTHRLMSANLVRVANLAEHSVRHPTPPASAALLSDLWIPGDGGPSAPLGSADDDEDVVFDPVQGGVMLENGFPRYRTAPGGTAIVDGIRAGTVTETVAPDAARTSTVRGEASTPWADLDVVALCWHGDEAARRGDLSGALPFWHAALRVEVDMVRAARLRDAVDLAIRLHALLHPAAARP